MIGEKRVITLASFIFPERLEWFLGYLEDRFRIPKDKVHIYKNLDDESKLIITFKLFLREGKRINIKSLFPDSMLIHKKGSCLYTINALNKLIEKIYELDKGNVNYSKFKINWDEYQGKLILSNNNELKLYSIERIEI